MGDIYIHIGYGRTGTSLLQNRIFPEIENLNFIGKTQDNYPNWLIAWHYLDDKAFNTEYSKIIRVVKNNTFRKKKSLISSEAFTLQGGNMLNQAHRIKKVVPNAKIILVVRHPIEYILSLYKYYIKAFGIIQKLEECLDWTRTPRVFHQRKLIYLPDLFYNEAIETYCDLFGEENICVLNFEDLQNDKPKFFYTLAEFINLKIDEDLIKHGTVTRVNASPDDSYVQHIRLNNIKDELIKILSHNTNQERLDDFDIKINLEEKIISTDLLVRLKKYYTGKCYNYLK